MKKLIILLPILLVVYSTSSQCIPDIDSGLLTHWELNGNANDASSGGHHGNIVGATSQSNRCEEEFMAMQFEGTGVTQYMDVADSPELDLDNTDFTISVWVYQPDTATFNNTILSKRTGYFLQDGYWFGISAGQVVGFAVAGGGEGSSWIEIPTPLCAQTWNHIVLTYDLALQTMDIYFNSELDTTVTGLLSPTPTSANLRIGNDILDNPYQFNGRIDDIRIYERHLLPCDIDSLFRNECIYTPVDCINTSVKEEFVPLILRSYPNPSHGKFLLELNTDAEIPGILTVQDVTGRIILEQKLSTHWSQLDLGQIAGIFYATYSNDNRRETIRLVIE